MKHGDFYEDDEPVGDVQRAFDAGPHMLTSAGPVRGWTHWLTPSFELRELSTRGGPISVRARREEQ